MKGTVAPKQQYLREMVKRAKQVGDYFWTDSRIAAKALLKHETLTGDEISAVIRAARRKGGRRRRTAGPPALGGFIALRRYLQAK
jgi:hypothetical protein